jgi:TonB family protein
MSLGQFDRLMPRKARAAFDLILAIGVAVTVPAAFAQHSLIVIRSNGVPSFVRAVINGPDGVSPEVANSTGIDLHIVESPNLRFPSAPTWGAGRIDVSNLKVEIVPGPGVSRVHGYLKSDTALSNCFVVFLAKSPRSGTAPAYNEIKAFPVLNAERKTSIAAGDPVALEQEWTLGRQFNAAMGTWELHFFSNGEEVPTTRMSPDEIAAAQVKSATYVQRDHPIALLMGVRPAYPEKPTRNNDSGSATLRCLVARNGNVVSIQIVAATDPAFGEAAAEAVHKWLFAPAVKGGQAVDQSVEIPINFEGQRPRAN